MGAGASTPSSNEGRRASGEVLQGTVLNLSNRRWSCYRDEEVADTILTDAPAADVRASVEHAAHAGQEPAAESRKSDSTPEQCGGQDVEALGRPKTNLLRNSSLEVSGKRNKLLPSIGGNMPEFVGKGSSTKGEGNNPAAGRKPRRSNMGTINIGELMKAFRDRTPANLMFRRMSSVETNVIKYCHENSFINTRGVVRNWPRPPLHVPAPVLDTQLVYSGVGRFALTMTWRNLSSARFSVLMQAVNPLAELLNAPKTAGPQRDAVFKSVTKEVTHTMGVAIAKLQVHPKDDDPLLKLGILQYIRGAFAIQCKQLPSVLLVKADDERLFMAGKNPVELVKAGLALLHLCADMTARFPDLKTTVSVGVAAGHILLLPNDYYGDAVNTASKLGEDNASPGELAVSRAALDVIGALDDGRELLRHVGVDEKEVLISKVNIQYAQLTLIENATIVALYPGLVVPSSMLVHSHIKTDKNAHAHNRTCLEALPLDWDLGSGVYQNPEDVRYSLTRECTMMQTDMSGFTRLTRQYGIMHFLALIMHCRRIYDESIGEFGGRVIKYDGDNVITFFPTPEMGVLAASRILYRTNEYNRCAGSNAMSFLA